MVFKATVYQFLHLSRVSVCGINKCTATSTHRSNQTTDRVNWNIILFLDSKSRFLQVSWFYWSLLNSFIELPWPSLSADMSLIEHMWDVLDKAVRQRPEEPRNLQELWLINRNGMILQFTLLVVWLDRWGDIAAQSLMRQVDTRDIEKMIKCDFENHMWLLLTG